jgi:glycogen debranching enzyme
MAVADRKRHAVLSVRPMLSGRDSHALHRENGAFRFDADETGDAMVWRPYDGLPAVCARSNGRYTHSPEWFRQFLYAAECDRGLDCIEDLASPGVFGWGLSKGDAVLMLTADAPAPEMGWPVAEKKRRARFATRLHRAADDDIVRRGAGKTIMAGYPWFTDWGRDTLTYKPRLP